MKLLAFLVLFISSQAFAQDDEDSSTTLCNNEKGTEFFAQIDGCSGLARVDFFIALADGDVFKATCDLLKNRVISILFFAEF